MSEIKSRDRSKPLENKAKRDVSECREGLGKVSNSFQDFNKSKALLTSPHALKKSVVVFIQFRFVANRDKIPISE